MRERDARAGEAALRRLEVGEAVVEREARRHVERSSRSGGHGTHDGAEFTEALSGES